MHTSRSQGPRGQTAFRGKVHLQKVSVTGGSDGTQDQPRVDQASPELQPGYLQETKR